MTERIRLGRSVLEVPRLGVGAMTWGSPSGKSRWGPAKLAYGGTAGPEEEQLAFEASLSAGVDLFDTAAMYSGGASERRVGELAEGRQAVIATKFPPGWLSTAAALPDALDQSLVRLQRSTIDLYQHHFPSRRISIPSLMGFMADAVVAGKVRAIGVSNYSAGQLRIAHAALAERGIPLASNQVEYSLLHRAPEVNGVLDACREMVSCAGGPAVAHRTGGHPANPGCEEREASGQQCRSAVLHAGCCRDPGARSSDNGLAEVSVITMAAATAWHEEPHTSRRWSRSGRANRIPINR
jgi:aryl-alcohol dehydrogenase-like predicted oxidoreductase